MAASLHAMIAPIDLSKGVEDVQKRGGGGEETSIRRSEQLSLYKRVNFTAYF